MKRVFSVFSFLLLITLVYSQYDPKENFYDAEFFFAEEDYAEALYAYKQMYKNGYEENSNINYRIGVCLLNLDGKKTESIPYLEKATKNITDKYKEGVFKEINAPAEVYLYLGNAYRIDNQFDKSIESYEKYLELVDDNSEQDLYVNLQIDACNRAKNITNKEGDYKIGTLGQVNLIKAPVYNPAVSGDLNTLAFMGKQKFYNGVYVSKKQNGKWLKPYNITPSIQSDGNQTVLALSYDGNKMLLTWADQFESSIWMSEYKNDRWYPSKPLDRPINSKFYESSACFAPDGNSIYFTSNRKESLGDMDIFKCEKNEDGSWGELILLGENVNTRLSEENPFISPDGKRIYFSSQGHPGLGGFDIFYCEINDDGTYGKPMNLDYPLNTTDDDFAYSPRNIESENYLTLYAKGDQDQVDLFRFEWIPETAQAVIVDFEETETPEEVVEEVTEVVQEEVAEETDMEEMVEEAPIEDVEKEEVAEVQIISKPIKPIFFDFDSYELTAKAMEKLNELAGSIIITPEIQIEIIGHTDNVGDMDYNKLLALNRAKSVAKYLISKGVNEKILTTVSKGELDPVAINRTNEDRDAPKGRALNRRVQFNVSVPENVIIKIEDIKVPDNLKIN